MVCDIQEISLDDLKIPEASISAKRWKINQSST